MFKKNKILLCFFIVAVSCNNNSEDDLTIPSNTNLTVTYTNSVKSIIDNNCVSCHGNTSPNGGLSLTNYNQVKNAMLNNGLVDRISRLSGDPQLMPTSGRMPQQTIDLVAKWNTDGLLE